MDVCLKYAKKIGSNGPNALRLQKQLINRWLENAGLEMSIKNGIDYFGLSFGHPEANALLGKALKKAASKV